MLGKSGVFRSKGFKDDCTGGAFPDTRLLKQLFNQGNRSMIVDTISHSLEQKAVSGEINAATLKLYEHSYLLVIYSILSDHAYPVHEADNPQLLTLMEPQNQRIRDLIGWIDQITETCMTALGITNTPINLIIQQTQKYVADHLSDPLSRDSIARDIHLNSDYLGRVFKKETGIFLSEYIQCQRIEKAKELLSLTNYSIGRIAMEVGFSGFSFRVG